jgi:hypothetical protein
MERATKNIQRDNNISTRILQVLSKELNGGLEGPLFPSFDLGIAHVADDSKTVSASRPVCALVSRCILAIAKNAVRNLLLLWG